MLYEVKKDANGVKNLELFEENNVDLEKDLENYLIGKQKGDSSVYFDYLQEELLLVSNQVKIRGRKLADIIALDKNGNGVVIELKRDKGMLGIDTQALQYLVDVSNYKGEDFIREYSKLKGNDKLEDKIYSFLGDLNKHDINKRTRIILVARRFDEVLFSMGEWLNQKGVSMKCICYSITSICGKELISFSVAFDRSDYSLYNLNSLSYLRKPKVFWHHIAESDQKWWEFLVENKQIPACFENSESDQGYTIMKSYVAGDRIIAYAKTYGAIGWGIIPGRSNWIEPIGAKYDTLNGKCRHRRTIEWKAVAKSLKDGINPDDVRKNFDIFHPLRTSVSIDPEKAERLIEAMNEKFNI